MDSFDLWTYRFATIAVNYHLDNLLDAIPAQNWLEKYGDANFQYAKPCDFLENTLTEDSHKKAGIAANAINKDISIIYTIANIAAEYVKDYCEAVQRYIKTQKPEDRWKIVEANHLLSQIAAQSVLTPYLSDMYGKETIQNTHRLHNTRALDFPEFSHTKIFDVIEAGIQNKTPYDELLKSFLACTSRPHPYKPGELGVQTIDDLGDLFNDIATEKAMQDKGIKLIMPNTFMAKAEAMGVDYFREYKNALKIKENFAFEDFSQEMQSCIKSIMGESKLPYRRYKVPEQSPELDGQFSFRKRLFLDICNIGAEAGNVVMPAR